MTGVARFDEIVFTDDFFRSSANALQSHPSNRRFLLRALSIPAARLGMRCREMAALSDGGTLDVAAMMKKLTLPQDRNGWARSGVADLEVLGQANLGLRFDPSMLVIGWGMPASLSRVIDKSGASFIDFEVAPIRFGSHLAFCARTNDRQIEQALEGWRISEEVFWNDAGVLKGFFARRGSATIFSASMTVGLFCGQTQIDLALVQDGKIMRPVDVIEHVESLTEAVDVLLIKSHPYEKDASHLQQLAARIPKATWTNANIYGLLCADNLAFISGLSSGALHEAGYFMKRSVPLITADRNNRERIPSGCSAWIPVGPDFMSLEGMAKICCSSGHIAPPSSPVAADALDRALSLRWGFDTDNPGLSAFAGLTLGRGYETRAGQAETTWLSFGWSAPEHTGVWTVGERACLVIPMEDGAPIEASAVFILMEGHVFTGAAARAPTIRARINGQRANMKTVRAGIGKPQVRFELSAIGEDIKGARVLLVELDIANSQRPSDGGISADGRLLGFHLRRLTVNADDAVLESHGSATQPRGTPAPGHEQTPGKGRTAAVAVLCLFAAAVLYIGRDNSPESAPSSFHWSDIKHSVAGRIDTLRDDLHAMFRPHHA